MFLSEVAKWGGLRARVAWETSRDGDYVEDAVSLARVLTALSVLAKA